MAQHGRAPRDAHLNSGRPAIQTTPGTRRTAQDFARGRCFASGWGRVHITAILRAPRPVSARSAAWGLAKSSGRRLLYFALLVSPILGKGRARCIRAAPLHPGAALICSAGRPPARGWRPGRVAIEHRAAATRGIQLLPQPLPLAGRSRTGSEQKARFCWSGEVAEWLKATVC